MSQHELPAGGRDLATTIDQAANDASHRQGDKEISALQTIEDGPLEEEQSKPTVLPGVARVEAAASQLTNPKRWTLFSIIFIFGFAYGLDALLRTAFITYAVVEFQDHSLIATITVVRGVMAAAVQPTVAKFADAFGRVELFSFGVLVYTLGAIVSAASANIQTLAAGAVLSQVGYSIFVLTLDIIIADLTSMKTRLFFAYIPNLSFLISPWIAGDVTAAILKATTWSWGIGIFAILVPVFAIPMAIILWLLGRNAKKTNPNQPRYPSLKAVGKLAGELDLVGMLLITLALALILTPLTLAGGNKSKWDNAGVLAPIILGILIIPCFIFWERKTSSPLLPDYLLTDKTVWACIIISVFYSFGYMCHSNYLFTLLIVSYNFSLTAAVRVSSVAIFCNVFAAFITSMVVVKVRRLKGFIVGGISIAFLGFGLAYHYRGGTSSQSGLIGAEVVLGIGGGLFAWTALVLAQTAARHEHIGMLIALMFSCNSIGTALGGCIAGAIWTQTLYATLLKNVIPAGGSAELVMQIYAAPLQAVPMYPLGSPVRDSVIESYRYIQRLLSIACLAIYTVMFVVALFLRDPRLSDLQTQPEAGRKRTEKRSSGQDDSQPASRWLIWWRQ
ncbi:hypothetical protein DV738_g643, partial [Chaetothyriales sp. CBS 135597]